MNLQLRSIAPENIPELIPLAQRIWNHHYPPIVGQEQVDYMLGKMYSEASLLEQMQTGHEFYFIEKEGKTLGFISASKKGPQEYFIHKFYVDQDAQGQGVGEAAFRKLLELLYPVHTLHLQVNRMNHTAINFYFKIGFKIEQVIDINIGGGYEMNDFLMVWNA